MGSRVDPGLHREIAKFGGKDVTLCMNCGNCTATCTLSTEQEAFPRRIIHLLQVGHKEKLSRSLEPWLCYYCGDCSDTCPREANPGETMMAARRYLTSLYDWTGLGKKFYTSPAWEIGAMALLGLFVVALFAFFHGPVVTDRVELNTFAPVKWVEIGDWIMGGTLAFLLFTNARRMYRFVLGSEEGLKIPASLLFREARTSCAPGDAEAVAGVRRAADPMAQALPPGERVRDDARPRRDRPEMVPDRRRPPDLPPHPAARILRDGRPALRIGGLPVGRLKRREPIHKSSEASDWIFLSLMFLVALTGILVHGFRLAGLPLATYVTYVIHLALVAPFLVVEVPFGKWSHMLYRPFAVYLAAVKRKATERTAQAADAAA
jgi:ferredoxin